MVQDLYLKMSEPIKHIIQGEIVAAHETLKDLKIKLDEEYKLPQKIHLCQLGNNDVREDKNINYFTYSEVQATLQVDKKYLKLILKPESLLDAMEVEDVVENCKSRTNLAKFNTSLEDEKIRHFNALASK